MPKPEYTRKNPREEENTLAKNVGGHCGCCTYLSVLDPILHSIIAEQGAKLGDGVHCKCCTYWRAKGVHQDISKARRVSRPIKAVLAQTLRHQSDT